MLNELEIKKVLVEFQKMNIARAIERMKGFAVETAQENELQIILRGHLYLEREIEQLLKDTLVS